MALLFKRIPPRSLLAVVSIVLSLQTFAAESSGADASEGAPPAGAKTYLIDHADLFSDEEESEFELRLGDLYIESACPTLMVTMPGRQPGTSLRDVGAYLFNELRLGSMKPSDPHWENGILILIDANQRVSHIHCANGWDGRDVERIRRVNGSVMLPLVSQNDPAAAVRRALAEIKQIASSKRTRIDSYWQFYVDTQREQWRILWRDLVTLVTAPTLKHTLVTLFLIMGGIFAWECVRPWRKDQERFREGFALDLFYTVFSYVFFWGLVGTALCTLTAAMFDNALYDLFGIENLVAVRLTMMPTWMRLVSLLLAMEFFNYWIHRLLHHHSWAWEFHKIHHSAPKLDVLNAARLHFGERLIYQAFSYVPLSMIGFEVSATFYMGLFQTFLSNLTHANVQFPIGPLKYIINTPQLHIWHHENEYHKRGNVNFGDSLIIWDLVFGTFYLPKDPVDTSKLQMGFDGIENYPQTFIAQTVLPFKAIAQSIATRLRGGS
ncbi:MAG: sterol desaturase family protein [Planctomycetota bacterium]